MFHQCQAKGYVVACWHDQLSDMLLRNTEAFAEFTALFTCLLRYSRARFANR